MRNIDISYFAVYNFNNIQGEMAFILQMSEKVSDPMYSYIYCKGSWQ